jgi:hypothetical protein
MSPNPTKRHNTAAVCQPAFTLFADSFMDLNESHLRPLVQQLSRAAVTLDRALFGLPVLRARDVDYEARLRKQRERAIRQLGELRAVLEGMRF